MSKQDPDRTRFGQLVISVARLWRRAADKALDDCGLSHATAMPLVMLSRLGDNLRQGVLADHLGFEGPSVVRIVDLLVEEGLVVRAGDAADRRAKIVSLTDAGRQRVIEIERTLTRLRAELLSEVDQDELAGAVQLLGRLEALGNSAGEGGKCISKTEIDGIIAMVRGLDKIGEIMRPDEAAKENQIGSDEDVAAVLQLVNDRIIALARELAASLVAQGWGAEGLADPQGMDH